MKQVTSTVKVADSKAICTSQVQSDLVHAYVDDQGLLMIRFDRGRFGAEDPAGLVVEIYFNRLETGKIRSALLKGATNGT